MAKRAITELPAAPKPPEPLLLAFHDDPRIKKKYLKRIRQHQKADELLQGYGYYKRGRGCAVGCTMHTDDEPHMLYPEKLGIPIELAYLEDAIFEDLSAEDAKRWPSIFLDAIPVGADLSKVADQLCLWMLRDSDVLLLPDSPCRTILTQCITILERRLEGKSTPDKVKKLLHKQASTLMSSPSFSRMARMLKLDDTQNYFVRNCLLEAACQVQHWPYEDDDDCFQHSSEVLRSMSHLVRSAAHIGVRPVDGKPIGMVRVSPAVASNLAAVARQLFIAQAGEQLLAFIRLAGCP